jgi:hypothetical protein
VWERRILIRTWAQRGTLHLHAAADWPVYAAALGTHDRWWKGAWLRTIGTSAEELRRYLAAYGPSTREEFAASWGTQPAPAGRVLASMPDGGLEQVQVAGRRGPGRPPSRR